MKNFLLSIAIVTGLAACNSESQPIAEKNDIHLLPDSTAYNNNMYSDTASAKAAVLPAKVNSAPTKIVYITRKTIYTPVSTRKENPVNTTPAATSQTTPVPATTTTNAGTTTSPAAQTGGTLPGNAGSGTARTTTQPAKDKGWSSAAKGAVIGAGTGAIGGAILSKKKGKGAIIGGIVGAAGGYIIGKNIDKKNNR